MESADAFIFFGGIGTVRFPLNWWSLIGFRHQGDFALRLIHQTAQYLLKIFFAHQLLHFRDTNQRLLVNVLISGCFCSIRHFLFIDIFAVTSAFYQFESVPYPSVCNRFILCIGINICRPLGKFIRHLQNLCDFFL